MLGGCCSAAHGPLAFLHLFATTLSVRPDWNLDSGTILGATVAKVMFPSRLAGRNREENREARRLGLAIALCALLRVSTF